MCHSRAPATNRRIDAVGNRKGESVTRFALFSMRTFIPRGVEIRLRMFHRIGLPLWIYSDAHYIHRRWRPNISQPQSRPQFRLNLEVILAALKCFCSSPHYQNMNRPKRSRLAGFRAQGLYLFIKTLVIIPRLSARVDSKSGCPTSRRICEKWGFYFRRRGCVPDQG